MESFSYTDAIDLSKDIIQKRARDYRNMVVVLSLLLLVVIITCLWSWSFIPLAYLILFWPAYSLFLLGDQFKIYAWKEKLLSAWSGQQIELSIAQTTIKSLPYIPEKTIDTLFAALPTDEAEAQLKTEERKIYLQHQYYLHKLQKIFYSGNLLRSLITTSLMITSIHSLSWVYLLGLIVIFLYKHVELWLLRKCWKNHLAQKNSPGMKAATQYLDQMPLY